MMKKFVYSAITNEFNVQELDCASKIAVCGSGCCKLEIILTLDEVQSGLFDYDTDKPYYLKKDKSGYCTYLKHGKCSIWDNRPKHCAGFVCSLFDETKEDIFKKIEKI